MSRLRRIKGEYARPGFRRDMEGVEHAVEVKRVVVLHAGTPGSSRMAVRNAWYPQMSFTRPDEACTKFGRSTSESRCHGGWPALPSIGSVVSWARPPRRCPSRLCPWSGPLPRGRQPSLRRSFLHYDSPFLPGYCTTGPAAGSSTCTPITRVRSTSSHTRSSRAARFDQ
jgi:hypothetical protein